MENVFDFDPFNKGEAREAIYWPQTVRNYQGNPFIEALGPLLERDEALKEMAYYPVYEDADRQASKIEREHMVAGLEHIRHPLRFHAELYSRLSRLMRTGYAARNPLDRFFQRRIAEADAQLMVTGNRSSVQVTNPYRLKKRPISTASGLIFLGITGIGKTVAVDMCLSLWPPLIIHTEYNGKKFGRTQIPYIKLDAPRDGSLHALTKNFFQKLDDLHAGIGMKTDYVTDYTGGRITLADQVRSMARLAALHGLGMLVLDEIQDLEQAGSTSVLSFLVQLVNTVGVPVVLIGGIDGLRVLGKQFRQARRGASQGDLIITRSEQGQEWREFCDYIWQFQYTAQPTELNDDLREALYDVSQGITHYVVAAYMLAQIRAINNDLKRITPGLIRSAPDSLTLAGPVLNAIRREDWETLRRKGDVVVPDGYQSVPFMRGDSAPRGATAPEDTALPDTEADGAAGQPEVDEKVTASATETSSQRQGGKDLVGKSPSPPTNGSNSPGLPDLMDALGESGSLHESLRTAKVVGGPVWDRIIAGCV